MSSAPGTPLARSSPSRITTPSRRNEDDDATPTKSVGMSAGLSAQQRLARRAELRQFYGIKGDSAAGNESGQSEDPTDIDSPGFDKEVYYKDLVAKSSLADLMKTASKLGNDVGTLQGSRHALVYNHHHQLFAAGDTISHLNSRTPELLGIMTSLQTSFSEISRLAEEVAMQGPEPEEEGEKWNREMERVRLMVLAEEPKSTIRSRLDQLRDLMTENDEGKRRELDELSKIVDDLEERA